MRNLIKNTLLILLGFSAYKPVYEVYNVEWNRTWMRELKEEKDTNNKKSMEERFHWVQEHNPLAFLDFMDEQDRFADCTSTEEAHTNSYIRSLECKYILNGRK